jgi:hypothetical protein
LGDQRQGVSVEYAAERTGLSVNSIRRRIDAHIAGDKSEWALVGWTTTKRKGTGAEREADADDVERLRRAQGIQDQGADLQDQHASEDHPA